MVRQLQVFIKHERRQIRKRLRSEKGCTGGRQTPACTDIKITQRVQLRHPIRDILPNSPEPSPKKQPVQSTFPVTPLATMRSRMSLTMVRNHLSSPCQHLPPPHHIHLPLAPQPTLGHPDIQRQLSGMPLPSIGGVRRSLRFRK